MRLHPDKQDGLKRALQRRRRKPSAGHPKRQGEPDAFDLVQRAGNQLNGGGVDTRG